jgi:hypothetical protein
MQRHRPHAHAHPSPPLTTLTLLHPPLHKLRIILTHLHRAPLPSLIRMHLRSRNIATLRRLQLPPKDVSHPNQNAIRPPKALNNLVLPASTRSISAVVRVLLKHSTLGSRIRAFKLWQIRRVASRHALRAERRVDVALAEVES